MIKTIGISPKVFIPTLGQVVIGIAFILFGMDVEGKTAIVTGLGTLLVGFRAPNSPTITVAAESDPQEDTNDLVDGVELT